MLERGADELPEQGRGPLGAGLELGVELGGDEERVSITGSSITSTSRSSGEVPEQISPAASSRRRRWLLTS